MRARTVLIHGGARSVLAVMCAVAIGPGNAFAFAPVARPVAQTAQAPQEVVSEAIPPDQLDSLVAPIALYPDPLLAQTLAASTYPLELMQLQQWLAKHPGLKDKALADAVAQQPWDASVQSMAVLPDVVKWLTDDIQWTTDLGNAFLAQQSGVMDAVQRMRQKAQGKGNLQSTQQQVVETRIVEEKQVIVIEQSQPEVVYVPSYDPMVVYGAPVYPYPPIYYPPAGYYAAGAAVSFGVGVAMGAFWGGGGGGWGWNSGWGNNDININNNNNFVRNSNVRSGNRTGNNTWQHRPEHRGGAPYRDKATANRYGGTARGDSLANRQAGARQQVSRQGGNLPSSRSGAVGTGGRVGDAGAGVANRASGAARDGTRASGADRGSRPSGGGADRVGTRDVSRSGGGDHKAFGGGSHGFSGSSARSSSSRGSSSMRSSGGGFSGGSRSGGGGGARRGGGGGGGRR